MSRSIKFSKNWNNKLENDHFTTIRPAAYDYTNDEYKIKTPKGFNDFKAEVNIIKELKLKDFAKNSWITYLDAAMGFQEFYNTMEEFYSEKDFWNYKNTDLVLLLISKKGEVK